MVVYEFGAAHELGGALGFCLAELARHKRDLGVRRKPREPIVSRDEKPRYDHAPAFRYREYRNLLPAAHEELGILMRRVPPHAARNLVARPYAIAHKSPRVALGPVGREHLTLLEEEARRGAHR